MSREPDSNSVKLVYVMERRGSLVTAVAAVDRMRLIGDQEAALGLGYVIVTKAERTSALSQRTGGVWWGWGWGWHIRHRHLIQQCGCLSQWCTLVA